MTVPVLRNPYHWPRLFNGSTWDDYRNNTQGTLLASAVRTATIVSPDQTNYNARGVALLLNVTAASGTGGLTLQVTIKDSLGIPSQLSATTSPVITTTGARIIVIYPGAGSTGAATGVIQEATLPLPRTWYATVGHGDGSSYTYSLSYSYIL